jgi:hypothetical protein
MLNFGPQGFGLGPSFEQTLNLHIIILNSKYCSNPAQVTLLLHINIPLMWSSLLVTDDRSVVFSGYRFSSLIKLTPLYNWNIVECGYTDYFSYSPNTHTKTKQLLHLICEKLTDDGCQVMARWAKKGLFLMETRGSREPVSITWSVVFSGYRFSSLIKLTPLYNWNIVECGIKHANPNQSIHE